MASACMFRRVPSKRNANSPPKKRIASRHFGSVQNKMQESVLSKVHNRISSSPKQCTRKRKGQRIVTRRDSNGRFRRELS